MAYKESNGHVNYDDTLPR